MYSLGCVANKLFINVMGFLGTVIVLVIIGFILRVLRSIFVWLDYIAYALIFICSIIVWISDGFGPALITFFGGAIAISLLFGIGSKTEIRKFGHKYSLECSKCGYGNLEIIRDENDVVITKCKRCGQVEHTLNH